jgi:hypothetical protein
MNDDGGMLLSLLPFFILSFPFAVVNYFLAPRLGKSGGLWAVLSLIPFINLVCVWYLLYCALFSALDRLAALEKRVG